MNTQQLRRRVNAQEYFAEIIEKMKELKEVFERQEEELTLTLFTNCMKDDSSKIVDFILVFDRHTKPISKQKVNKFLGSLVEEGMSLEGHESVIYPNIVFIKIHCPRQKLIKAGIVLDMNLSFLSDHDPITEHNLFFNFDFLFNDITRPKERSEVGQRAKESTFNIKPKDITNVERIMVIYEILNNIRYGVEDDEFGMLSLLQNKHLLSFYPLHEGPWEWTEEGPLNDRQLLGKFWAARSNSFKIQPLDLLRKYFGPEVAFYFAFMGFFNKMLIVPACVGIIGMIYGILTYNDHRNYISEGICSSDKTVCPPCYEMSMCSYQTISTGCLTSKIHYIFDNIGTTSYAVLWCLWSTFIYAKWKQHEAVLMYKWDLMELESEVTIRPEFLMRAMRNAHKRNRATTASGDVFLSEQNQVNESRYLRGLRFYASGIMIFAVILLVLLGIYLEIYVRILFGRLFNKFEGQFSFHPKVLLLSTAGNLFVLLYVCIAEELFVVLAHFVTDFENPRTQEEYEQSYVYKYSVLCVMTSYSFICYTAFLKGYFTTHPGDVFQYKLLGILQYDSEKIHASYLTVSYQWTILAVGKQVWRGIGRLIVPKVKLLWIKWRERKQKKRMRPESFENEFKLFQTEHSFLLDNNMQIVLQYGYLVLFPAAQPLGPLGFFLYNIWSMRSEAKRILTKTRRVIPVRCHGLGPWLKIIKMLTILGMGTNVCFIAFSTDFVHNICKWFSPHYNSYINFTYSEFAVDDFPSDFGRDIKKGYEGTTCYYKGNRYPPSSRLKYELKIEHWNKISMRFLTIIVIQSCVMIFSYIILHYFGGTPISIKERINHRINVKRQQREEKFRRDRPRRSTVAHIEVTKNFKVIDY